MAQKILIKKSGVQGITPTTAQLDFGELAVNYRDNKIYFKANDGTPSPAGDSIVAVEFNPNGAYAKTFVLNGNNLEVRDASGNVIDTVDFSAFNQDLSGYQLRSEKGVANGYASLDSTGKVPTSELPAIAITDVSVVNTIAERDALTVEEGDVAIVTNNVLDPSQNGSYIYDSTAWQLIQAPGGSITSVNGDTGPIVQLDAVNIPYSNLTSLLTATEVQGAIDEIDGRVDTAETQLVTNTTLLGLLDTAVNDPSTGLLVTVQGLTTDVGQLQTEVGVIETTLGAGGTAGAAESFVATDANGNLIYLAQDDAGSVIISDGDGTFSVFDLTTALGLKANVADVLDSADLAGNILNLRDVGNNIIASVDLSSLDNQTAAEVSFDPSTSTLTSVTVQLAIEELNTKVDNNASDILTLQAAGGEANVQADLAETNNTLDSFVLNKDSQNIAYDNTISGLAATNVKTAIDELDGRLDTAETDIDALEAVTSGLTATEFVITDASGNLDTVTPGTDEFLKYDGVNFVSTNIVDGGSF